VKPTSLRGRKCPPRLARLLVALKAMSRCRPRRERVAGLRGERQRSVQGTGRCDDWSTDHGMSRGSTASRSLLTGSVRSPVPKAERRSCAPLAADLDVPNTCNRATTTRAKVVQCISTRPTTAARKNVRLCRTKLAAAAESFGRTGDEGIQHGRQDRSRPHLVSSGPLSQGRQRRSTRPNSAR